MAYPYLVHEGDPSRSGFALVYLHGSEDRGDSFAKLESYALPRVIGKNASYDFQTICPLCPEDETWLPEKVSDFLMQLKASALKGKRVILTGYSMGGTGAYDLQSLYPGLVDALAIVAGRTRLVNIENLAMVSILALYGELDERLKVSGIEDLRDAINRQGGRMELILYPNLGHHSAEAAYSDERFFRWVAETGTS